MARPNDLEASAFETAMRDLMPPAEGTDDGPVAVAVSGGPDSLALAALAQAYFGRTGRPMRCVTVDHGLRPEAADEAEAMARQLRAAGLDATVLHYDGPKPESNVQAAARSIRFGLIADWMAQGGMRVLLLGHHSEDQAETLLLRLARGSGVDGLSAMAPVTRHDGLTVIRPLLDFRKAELARIAERAGFDPVEDPSNADPAFARVRIRRLSEALEKEGLTADRISETARRMARARAALEAARDRFVAEHVDRNPAGFARFEPAPFVELPEEIGLRVLSQLIRVLSGAFYPAREQTLMVLHEKIVSGALSGETLSGAQVRPWREGVLICREAGAVAGPEPLRNGLRWDNRYVVRCGAEIAEGLSVGALGADRVPEAKSLTPDAIMALPGAVRPTLPALYREGRLVAVPHLGWSAAGAAPIGSFAFRAVPRVWGAEFRQELPFSKGCMGPM